MDDAYTERLRMLAETPKAVLKVKKLVPEAILPSRVTEGDVGYDCVAINNGRMNAEMTYIEYDTGISIELPSGYHAELFPRSSVSKFDLILCNGIGLIDNGYRGEIKFRYKLVTRPMGNGIIGVPIIYKKGDKIGQIVIRKSITDFDVHEVEELSSTERGSGGFGSTDKK